MLATLTKYGMNFTMVTKEEIEDLAKELNFIEPTQRQIDFILKNYYDQAETDPSGEPELWTEQLLYDAEVLRLKVIPHKADFEDGSSKYGAVVFCGDTPIKCFTCDYSSEKDIKRRFDEYKTEVSIKPNKRRDNYYFLTDKQGGRHIKIL
jgi:hypothetical protein